MDLVPPSVLLSTPKRGNKRETKPTLPRIPDTPMSSQGAEDDAGKGSKKKKSFWKRPFSSSSKDGEKKKDRSAKKEREELKPPTFWAPM